jgi:tetratricopeptide (TPR) repeat protein
LSQQLFNWPVLRTLGLYLGGCWVAVEFADWLVSRYELPPRVVDIALIGLLSFTPAVALLAYYHAAPGRQRFRMVEKIGVPINAVISLAVVISLLIRSGEPTPEIESVTVTVPSGEAITRPLVQASTVQGVSVFFFDNETGNEALDWLQYAATIGLSADLRQHPFVEVWTPYAGMESYGMFQLRKAGYDDGLEVPIALMRNIASQGGMEHFVTGTLQPAAEDGFVLAASLYTTATAQRVADVRLPANTDRSFLAAIDRVTEEVLAALDLPAAAADTNLPVVDRLTESIDALAAHTRALNARIVDGDNDQAIVHWQQAIATDPSFAVAHFGLGRALFDSGRMVEAGSSLQQALRHDYKLVDHERFITKGLNYTFQGQRDKELATYQAWTELRPQDPLAFSYLASAYLFAANDAVNARIAYERVYELDPRQDWVLAKIAYLHELTDNREAAIEYYTRSLDARPDAIEPLIKLGHLYRREGDLERARELFERAAIVASGLVDPSLELADLNLREGRYEAALARLDEAERIATAPRQRAAVLRGRIAYHAARGQQEAVLSLLPELARWSEQFLSPIDVMMSVWVDNIRHFAMTGRTDEAVRILRDFENRMQPPLNALVDVGYLRLSLALGDAEAAMSHGETVEALMETLSLDYLSYWVAYSRGLIYGLQDDPTTAIEQLEQSIRLYDTSVTSLTEEADRWQIMTDLAEFYRATDRTEQARQQWEAILDVFPSHAVANLGLARLARDRNDTAAAARHLATVNAALQDADENYPLRLAAIDLDASLGT